MPARLTLPERPPVAPPARWQFPVPDRRRLGNGVTVLTHHMPGQYVATITCHLAVSADAEPDGCDGIAVAMAASVGGGAGGLTGRELGQRAAAAGITWGATAGWTGPSITMELPARNVPAALDLLRLALAEPAFTPDDVASQVQRGAARLASAAGSPPDLAQRQLPAAIYGHGHRAGRTVDGSLETIIRLTPQAIAGFHDAWARPARTTIVIAGDLTSVDAAGLAEEAFATWDDDRPTPGGTRPEEPLPREEPAAVLVSQPGAPQAQLLLAIPVPGRGQPDWGALQVAANILGAPISGRLDARVRQESGTSYGLQAGLTEHVPGTGLFLVTGAVATAAAMTALADIRDILTAPLSAGFSDADRDAAAEGIARTLPLAYETPALLAATTADLAACGLPPGYPSQFLDGIKTLTTSTVNDAYKRHIRPDRLTIIAVGDPATLAGPLQQLAAPASLQVIST